MNKNSILTTPTPHVFLVIVRDAGSRKPQRRPAGGREWAPAARNNGLGQRLALRMSPSSTHQRTRPTRQAIAFQTDPTRVFTNPHRRHGFAQHSREHGHTKTCARCQWASRRFQWMYTTPVNPAFKKSWTEVAPPTSGRWGLGCWVCRQASGREHVQAAFSNCMVRRPIEARLMRHQRSDRHKRSVQTILHQRGLVANDDGASLPAPRWVNHAVVEPHPPKRI